jgi:carboxymethylenebutenolidase
MRQTTRARRTTEHRATLIGALLVLAASPIFSGTVEAKGEQPGADDGHAAAMAREHATDSAAASPAATAAPREAVSGSDVVYGLAGGKQLGGYLALPTAERNGRPALIVIHEWWGLNENIRSMARQLAGEGYVALAVDLYGGRVADTPKAAMALMKQAAADPEQMKQSLILANAYLLEQGAPRTGSIGWCFGGGMSLEAGLVLGDSLAAVVMYYGRPVSDLDRLQSLEAPLLGLFGEEDSGIPVAGVRTLEANLKQLGKSARIQIYPGAGHAFANPSGSRYQAEAAQDAWARTLAFFAEHLKR